MDTQALELLRNGAALLISVSGGKDSDAMLNYLVNRRALEGWQGEIILVHADLGRAEWHYTPAYVQGLADRYGLELVIVQHPKGDLIDRIWARHEKDSSRPSWPSSKARYCTSDLKRAPIDVFIRNRFPSGNVVVTMGLRAAESSARAKKAVWERREACCSKVRAVYNWLPIHSWSDEAVWRQLMPNQPKTIEYYKAGWAQHQRITKGLGRSTSIEKYLDLIVQREGRLPCHPAYILGNQRLSCALCVLGSRNDLINGAIHNPAVYEEYVKIEEITGFTFRPDVSLKNLLD